MVAVPDRLEDRVAEAKVEQVLYRLFAEVVVDAEDRRLGEHGQERAIERLRRREIVAERPLRHDATASRAAGAAEPGHHRREQARRNGEVVQRPLGSAQSATEQIERRRLSVVAVHVAEKRRELVERGSIDSAVRLQALPRACSQSLEIPTGLRLQRREDLLVREVSGRAEEHQGVRPRGWAGFRHCRTASAGARWTSLGDGRRSGVLLMVPPELKTHRRKQPVGEVILTA
jgi:hypothetical protein